MTAPAPPLPYVMACAVENVQADGSCSVPVWVEYQQPVLPYLSAADGTLVSFAIVSLWAVGLIGRACFKAARSGGYT